MTGVETTPYGHLRLLHVGLDIDYYHPDGKDLRLSREVEDAYGLDKERAKIFTHNRDRSLFDSKKLLETWLRAKGRTLNDYIPEKFMAERKPYIVVVPLKFPEGLFSIETVQGPVDVKAVNIAVQVMLPERPEEEEGEGEGGDEGEEESGQEPEAG